MGVFDHLTCEVELPGHQHAGVEFQTKDLDCTLASYVITSDGTLWRETGRSGRERVMHDGAITFYAYEARRRIEYAALFKAGRLVHLIPMHEPAR